jgi:hypothetical protein
LLDLISLADASHDFENTDELLAAAANFADLMKGFLDGAKDLKGMLRGWVANCTFIYFFAIFFIFSIAYVFDHFQFLRLANSATPGKVAPKINASYQQLDAQMKCILVEMKKCGAMNPEMQHALAKIMAGMLEGACLGGRVVVVVVVVVVVIIILIFALFHFYYSRNFHYLFPLTKRPRASEPAA